MCIRDRWLPVTRYYTRRFCVCTILNAPKRLVQQYETTTGWTKMVVLLFSAVECWPSVVAHSYVSTKRATKIHRLLWTLWRPESTLLKLLHSGLLGRGRSLMFSCLNLSATLPEGVFSRKIRKNKRKRSQGSQPERTSQFRGKQLRFVFHNFSGLTVAFPRYYTIYICIL